jgi:hypothetical protein
MHSPRAATCPDGTSNRQPPAALTGRHPRGVSVSAKKSEEFRPAVHLCQSVEVAAVTVGRLLAQATVLGLEVIVLLELLGWFLVWSGWMPGDAA